MGNGFDMGFSQLTNVRDLGGIAVRGGGHTRSNLLVRSEALSNASDDDLEQLLSSFDLSAIIDFRTEDEYNDQPDPTDRLPEVCLVHAPIINPASLSGSEDGSSNPEKDSPGIDAIISQLREKPTEFMCNMYSSMMLQERGKTGFATFFKTLLDTDRGAVLWHCTAGKDRTGMASALLLHVLGAADETIMDDYLGVNRFLESHRLQLAQSLAAQGLDRTSVDLISHAACAVDAELLQTAFTSIVDAYGSLDNYLVEALGVTPEAQEILRNRYLDTSGV